MVDAKRDSKILAGDDRHGVVMAKRHSMIVETHKLDLPVAESREGAKVDSVSSVNVSSSNESVVLDISLKNFEILSIIGLGAFGTVKRIERRKKKHEFALKYINKKKCIEKYATHNIFRERIVLQMLSHPNIINLRYAFQDDENLFMVLDFAEGGDLRCHIDRMKGFKDDSLVIMTAEIADALSYLHSNFIIHRDLKPENLLLDKEGHILLTDFNVCSNLNESKPSSPTGTRPYMAPEMFISKPYAYSVDWWALGIVLMECTYGKRPYKVERDWTRSDFEKTPLTFPKMYPKQTTLLALCPERESFYSGLLKLDTATRLGSSGANLGIDPKIKNHPWLKSIDWTLIKSRKLIPPYRPNLKMLNVDSSLLIEEIIGGGDGLSYKARRNSPKKDSFKSRFSNAFRSLIGVPRKVKDIEVTAIELPRELTRQEQEMKDMDTYYTNYSYECPNQVPMVLPPRVKKKKVTDGAKQKAGSESNLAASVPILT